MRKMQLANWKSLSRNLDISMLNLTICHTWSCPLYCFVFPPVSWLHMFPSMYVFLFNTFVLFGALIVVSVVLLTHAFLDRYVGIPEIKKKK